MDKAKILQGLTWSEDARLFEADLRAKYGNAMEFLEDKYTDTQGFAIVVRPKRLVLAFRGTQQLKDVLTDLNAFHMMHPYGNLNTSIQVHRGFMHAYLSVRKLIHDYARAHRSEFGRVFVTGHSLGGALATLCAVDLQYNFDGLPIECYISGNPMVGNPAFVKSYNKRVPKTCRTYMRKDPVPILPPSWFERRTHGGYAQHGTPFPIGSWNFFYGLLMAFRKRFNREMLLDDAFNHDIDMYRQEVMKTI